MPQLDVATFPPQLFWLLITFVVLYLLMAYMGLPRIGGLIAARRQRIDGDLAQAGQMKSEAEAVIAAYEKALGEARARAQTTLRETTERLNAEAAERQRKLAQALAGETAAAERRIAAVKAQAIAELGSVAAEAARAAMAKLTGAPVDAAHAEAAVRRVVAERG